MDFFGSLHSGMRFPDARINGGGPLPTSLSGPAGINGDADGQYNFNGNLLDGISPYAGPKQGRMGSDRNYQQIPLRKQYFVPPIHVPNCNGTHTVTISHPVDHGDLAFIVRAPRTLLKDGVHTKFTTPVLCNLVTANYLLAGVQEFLKRDDRDKKNKWFEFIHEVAPSFERVILTKGVITNTITKQILCRITSTAIIPYGICAGSEKQGGQSEMTLGPVHGVASFVTTLTLDGQNRDLVNVWKHVDVSAGDNLCLCLDKAQVATPFYLNHYYKSASSQTFPEPIEVTC